MRLAFALIVILALAFGATRVLDPHTWVLAQAVAALGPISGWRCAQLDRYVYDPNREQPDATLLAEAPEARLRAEAPAFEIVRVEASLRGGDTLVSVRAPTLSGEERRVYVLSPGRLQAITDGQATLCNAHLADWQIVGEQSLG